MSIIFVNGNFINCLYINDYSSDINNSSKYIKNKQDVCSRNHICRGKATSVTYLECVSVHLTTMHCACTVLYSHLWSVRLCQVFLHYLINSKIFGKKLLNIKYAYWLYLQILSKIFLLLWRIHGCVITNVRRSSCKVL